MTVRPPAQEPQDGGDPTPLVELLSDTNHAVLYSDGELVFVSADVVECSRHGVIETAAGTGTSCTHSPPADDEVPVFRIKQFLPVVLSSKAVRAAATENEAWIDWFATQVDGLHFDRDS